MFGRVCRVVLLLGLLSASGCVERALVITSEPSGAEVTVNQQWRGTTPFVVPFKHYGVYDIWIEHPGIEENGRMVKYYPLHVGEPVNAPGYQYPGADFVTEVLLPTTLRDPHNLHYRLERVSEADDLGDVLARAQQLRDAGAARPLRPGAEAEVTGPADPERPQCGLRPAPPNRTK
ncbi:MAG: PEGA domain-containing protein [Planctomycetes bacterium]|nr:PEGA domain-containing protein [Planctomycetota bacterium]